MMKDYGLYFIGLIPQKILCDRITKLKMELSRAYQSSHALKSPPHITLIPPFKLHVQNEVVLCHELDRFAAGQPCLGIEIGGFGAFKPRVIFLRILENDQLLSLQKSLVSDIKLLEQKQVRGGKPFHPHMTLAFRDLTKDMFHAAWSEYQKREFSASFEAHSIIVLKHSGKKWDIFHHAKLGVTDLSG